MHAVQAQFGASMGAILRPVDRIRVTRHEAEYPGLSTYIDEDSVLDDLPKAEAIVEAVAKALPHFADLHLVSCPAHLASLKVTPGY